MRHSIDYFLRTCVALDRDAVTSTADLYTMYIAWLNDGDRPIGRTALTQRVKNLTNAGHVKGDVEVRYGVHLINGKRYRGFRGMALLDRPRCKCPVPLRLSNRGRKPLGKPAPLDADVAQFLLDRCLLVDGHRTPTKDVYRAYFEWIAERDALPFTHSALTRRIKNILGQNVNVRVLTIDYTPHRAFEGLALKEFYLREAPCDE